MQKRCLFNILVLLVSVLVLTGCAGSRESDELKVITFNIRYDNTADGVNAWPKRAGQVASFLNEEKPDFFGLQEALLRQYNYLDSALSGYGSIAVGRSDGAQGGEMNPVFYREDRFDLVRTNTFWLSETPEVPGSKAWGSSLPRIVTWAELADRRSGEHIYYFNTHFAHDSDSARVKSSSLLLSEAERISGGSKFVITGDFNQYPDSKGYLLLTQKDNPDPLLKDSYLVSETIPYGPKYTFNGFTDTPGAGRIDYIFVKNGMRVLEHRTIFRKDKGVFISDHWPVVATVVTGNF
jgi:endonuclease/exonuclease/phosphatase family metal-dependent hydrolase